MLGVLLYIVTFADISYSIWKQPVLSHSDVSDSLKSYDFVSTHFRLSAIHADGVMPFTFLNNRLK